MFKSFEHASEHTVTSWLNHYTAASEDPNLARRVRSVTRRVKTAKPGLLNRDGSKGRVNQPSDGDATFAHLQAIANTISDMDSDIMSYATPRKVTIEGGSLRLDGQFRTNASSTAAPNHGHTLHTHTSRIFREPDGMNTNTLNAAGIFAAQPPDTTDQTAQTPKQIMCGGSRILSNNPCRRFVFGLSIEHLCLRFWYFSRSHIAVSEAFDYHEHPKHLVQFLMFLVSASPQELGFDPSARCVSIPDHAAANGKRVYDCQVGGDSYRTRDIFQGDRALDIVTRTLRIWKVRNDDAQKPKLGDETYVLKDAWLYEGCVSDEQDSGTRKLAARQYSMTTLHDTQVMFDDEFGTASTRPCLWPMVGAPKAVPTREQLQARRGEGGTQSRGRTRWRILYKEVCPDLYTATSPRLYFKALSTVVQGLKSVRLAEMVHGDLSPGNVLLFGSDGDAKIADLESCRAHITGTSRDPTYGTPAFLAIEICAGRHLFVKYPVKFFRHNFLHDLESCIWMALYFLFHRIPECLVSAKRMPLLHDLWHESLKLLNSARLKRDITARTLLFFGPYSIVFVGHLIQAYDEVPEMQGFFDAVLELREKLMKEYAVLEASLPVVANNVEQWDVDFFRLPFYDEFAAHFLHCSELVSDAVPFSSLREILEKASAVSLEEKAGNSDKDVSLKETIPNDSSATGQSLVQGKPLGVELSGVQATSLKGSPVMSKRKSGGGLEPLRSVKKPRQEAR